jgi:hypothetical protein
VNHLDILERHVRHWDHIMCGIDRLPGEAVFHDDLASRACYLKLLTELAACATKARDQLASQLAEDVNAYGRGYNVPNVGTLDIDVNQRAVIIR